MLPQLFRYAASLQEVGTHVTRVGLIIVLVWIGSLKFAAYEAVGIVPFVANSSAISFFIETFSRKIGYMGPAGSGQQAKLLNNALTMTNLKNAVDVLGLAGQLRVDVAALYDMVSVSSGSSAIIQALGTFTLELAAHLQSLMRKDIEHFADSVHNRQLDPLALRERGLSGADGLVEAVNILQQSRGGC